MLECVEVIGFDESKKVEKLNREDYEEENEWRWKEATNIEWEKKILQLIAKICFTWSVGQQIQKIPAKTEEYKLHLQNCPFQTSHLKLFIIRKSGCNIKWVEY